MITTTAIVINRMMIIKVIKMITTIAIVINRMTIIKVIKMITTIAIVINRMMIIKVIKMITTIAIVINRMMIIKVIKMITKKKKLSKTNFNRCAEWDGHRSYENWMSVHWKCFDTMIVFYNGKRKFRFCIFPAQQQYATGNDA